MMVTIISLCFIGAGVWWAWCFGLGISHTEAMHRAHLQEVHDQAMRIERYRRFTASGPVGRHRSGK